MEFIADISNASFAMKIDAAIKKDIDEFYDLLKARCSSDFEVIFSYKVVIAVK